EVPAVRRPTRRRVAWATGQLFGFACGRRDEPDRRVVAIFLVVDSDFNEGHARAVCRQLRIGDPVEVEQVLFGNVSLLSQDWISDDYECNEDKKKPKTHRLIPFVHGLLARERRY